MNLIFDFDGTICDSFEITIKVLNAYLEKLHKPLINTKKFRKEGIEEVIKDYHLNKIQQLIYIYKGRQELSKHINEMKTFPGMEEVLQKLSISNHLGIVSSNSKDNVEKFLKNNKQSLSHGDKLDKYFDFIYSSPTLFNKSKKIAAAIKKYGLKKDKTVYIGDEVRDIKAGHEAGLKVLSVIWGFADKKLLNKNNPEFIVDKPQDIIELIAVKPHFIQK